MDWGSAGVMADKRVYLAFILILLTAFVSSSAVADTDSDYALAQRYWKNGDYEKAAEAFKKVRDSATENVVKAALAYSLAQQAAGRDEEAEDGFRFFINSYPQSEFINTAMFRMINILISQGEYAEAAVYLHQLKIPSSDIALRQIRDSLSIVCYLGLQQYNNVAYAINNYITEYPDSMDSEKYELWLSWYKQEQNDSSAAADFQRLALGYEKSKITLAAKEYLVPLLIKNKRIDDAVKYMSELIAEGKQYKDIELLWLASYLADMRELAQAGSILHLIVEKPESSMIQAVALNDLARIQTSERNFHDALSNFPLVEKALMNADSSVGQIELLTKTMRYANALTLRKIGRAARARVILDSLHPTVYEPLYYQIVYEQGLVAMSIGDYKSAAEKLMQVGIFSTDPDLAGKALLRCVEACQSMNNQKLLRICLEELVGKNEGSYGRLYPNSPYTTQAYDIMNSQNK